MNFPARSKYHAHPVTVDGRRFASKREAARYVVLRLKERAGQIRNLRCQVPVPIVVNGETVTRWVADFVYEEAPEWRTIHEDCKGYRTDLYKLKKKLVAVAAGIEIRET